MDPNSTTASKRLKDLAQQLLVYKSSLQPAPNTNSTHQSSEQNGVVQQHNFNKKDEANLVTTPSKRFKPNRAAVLVCIFEDEEHDDLRVILTKRSSNLNKHSGEVALPGGKTEEGDENDVQTALREAHEEIGLDPKLVHVVAVLESFTTRYGVAVVPVIGILYDKKKFNPVANAAEVEAIFYAPLEMFLKDENRSETQLEWMGEKYLLHFFDFRTDNTKYEIWALTAGILITVASVVYQRQPAFTVLRPKFWSGNYQCKF
ncbi:nudix hydrolase 11-like isoform X1 [Apium graveolens]|uniref:nudix hydrolase 11-like isoform X1 n=1 Tax=Apium graveolens TaxID=4045 RepID=UPI003D7B46DC